MAHRILFACVENANRSQMAEAFARMHGNGLIEPASAGSQPAEAISPAAIAVMAERGYDLSSHRCRSIADVGPGPWDYVITMGCGDECPYLPAVARFDWDVADPRGLPKAEVARVRDEIEHRVLELLRYIRAADTPPPA